VRRYWLASIRMLLAALLTVPTFAASETVTGRLVDLACYGQDQANKGNEHKNRGLICAQACAREGFPVGLVTNDGKVYQVTGELAANSNKGLVPYMGQFVTLSGVISDSNRRLTLTAHQLKVVRQ
jgi:hypothetical protein